MVTVVYISLFSKTYQDTPEDEEEEESSLQTLAKLYTEDT
jgi:hypothetical protein